MKYLHNPVKIYDIQIYEIILYFNKKSEELNIYYHFIKHNKCNYIIGSNT